MTPHALLFTLASIGISETIYLVRKRLAKERPVCVIGEECHQVLESKYNKVLGVHNEFAGLLFYIAISFITALLVIGVEPAVLWGRTAKLFISAGTLMSVYLLFLQWRVIKVWCFWCVMSALTIFAMFAIAFASDLIITS